MTTKERIIRKLFAKQCTRFELELLFEMLQQDQEETGPEIMMELFEQLEHVPELEEAVSNEILEKIKKATGKKEETHKRKVIPIQGNKFNFWRGVAAAVAVVIVASWMIAQRLQPQEIIVQSPYGEMQDVVLPDGSLVTLNGNSKIEYLPEWSEGELRTIKLWGEAFFKVVKEPVRNTKFQVITEDLTVEVLGTAFNVNTRQEASEVFLEEGQVRLSLKNSDTPAILLQPGEVVTYSISKKLLLKPQIVDQASEISWKEGILTFKDTPLKKILEELFATNIFEFEIRDKELEVKEFTISVPNNDIDVAMNLLNKTVGAKIIREGDKFVILEK